MAGHTGLRTPVFLTLWALLALSAPVPAREAPDTYWDVAAPEEVGISSGALADMLERIRDEGIEIHSVIIVKDGRLVLEAYVHPYDRETLHNVKSVSKSVISALVGIALREGVIGGLDETVYEHLPQYITDDMDPRKKQINLRHLLTMTSGLDLDENGPISGEIFGTLDWLKATYERPMREDPGTAFLYSTPLTHTMSAILTESSGMSLHEFADIHLFGPLGFGEVQWKKGPRGYNFGGAELFMRPVDMAKFGYLYLNGGAWEGRQVVPADWVKESTGNKLADIEHRRDYGYWWWLEKDGWYYASGWGGQSIGINEDRDVVIVITAASSDAAYGLFVEFVVPWLDSAGPLEPDPQAAARLARVLYELAHPEPEVVAFMPALAGEISGRKYVMQWNQLGMESVVLTFRNDDTCLISFETALGGYDLVAGLDGVYRISDMGAIGAMPSGNRMAVRGRWVNDTTFHVSSREVGNPVYTESDYEFAGDGVEVTSSVEPIGRHITLKGSAGQ
jgi:CubicO group peptidase (beta-lactamase class C family)